MELKDFIAPLVAVLLLVIGLVKMELIKSFVNKISGKKYSLVLSLVLIFGLAGLSYYLTTMFVPATPEVPAASNEKTEFESYVDGGQDIADYAIEKGSDFKENKAEKDSIYEATRERRWVYQLGDMVTDKDLLTDTYFKVEHLDNIRVFEFSNNKFVLYKDLGLSEAETRDSFSGFKQQINDPSVACHVIDISAMCGKKEKVVRQDDLKVGRGKEKLFLPCYACGK